MGKRQEQDNGKLKSIHPFNVDIPGSMICKILCILLAALREKTLSICQE